MLEMLQQIKCELGSFPLARLRQINCRPEHNVQMSGKKRAWLSRPYCYLACSIVSAHMTPYFLLSEARWRQRGANGGSLDVEQRVSLTGAALCFTALEIIHRQSFLSPLFNKGISIASLLHKLFINNHLFLIPSV